MNKQLLFLASNCGKEQVYAAELSKYFEIKQVSSDYIQFTKSLLENNCKGIYLSNNSIKTQIIFNKFEDIRAAICYNQYMATMCREHNDANVLVIPLDFISENMGLEFGKDFWKTEFDTKTTPNHQRRVNKLKLLNIQ